MEKRLQQIRIVEINGEPVTKAPESVVLPSAPKANESIDLIAQLHKNIQTLEDIEFKFSFMLNEVKSLV